MSENTNPSNDPTPTDNQHPAASDVPTVDLGATQQAQTPGAQQPLTLPEAPAWAGPQQGQNEQASTPTASGPAASAPKKERKPVSWLTPLWASVAAAGIAVVAFAGGAGTVAAVEAVQHADRPMSEGSGDWGGHDGRHEGGRGAQGDMGGGTRSEDGGMRGGPQGGMPGERPNGEGPRSQSDLDTKSGGGSSDSDANTEDGTVNGSTSSSSTTQETVWVLVS